MTLSLVGYAKADKMITLHIDSFDKNANIWLVDDNQKTHIGHVDVEDDCIIFKYTDSDFQKAIGYQDNGHSTLDGTPIFCSKTNSLIAMYSSAKAINRLETWPEVINNTEELGPPITPAENLLKQKERSDDKPELKPESMSSKKKCIIS